MGRPPGAMSEEVADNTLEVSLRSTEEPHGETATPKSRPKCTLDAEPSLTSVRLPVQLLFRRLATKWDAKASRWPATGARRVVTLTPLESTRATVTTGSSETERSATDDSRTTLAEDRSDSTDSPSAEAVARRRWSPRVA